MIMNLLRERNRYITAVAATVLFAVIYECFSHEVYSDSLLFAFAFPLMGGVIPWTVLLHIAEEKRPGILSRCLYSSGIATLTVGSLFQGILEIYGTTSCLTSVYWVVGAVLLAVGLLFYRRG